jgi:hypothetical protein
MSPPVDYRDPGHRTLSRGRCFLYVLPCAWEDQLKLGFSREPLDRLQALHRRWFEVFDLDRAFLVEAETVGQARALELALRRQLVAHNAPAPLTVREAAGGHTEWYRGAGARLAQAGRELAARGHVLHVPARPWLRRALLARGDLLFSWTQAMLGSDELESAVAATPLARTVRDVLDAYAALDIELEPRLPEAVLRWHRQVAAGGC